MTKPGQGRSEEPRPDEYQCPHCKRWRGQHFTTGLLSRHRATGGSQYDLCKGSLSPLQGLPARMGGHTLPARYTAPYSQPPLFHEP